MSGYQSQARGTFSCIHHPTTPRGPSLRAMGFHRQASSPFHDSWQARPAMYSESSKGVKGLKVLARGVLFLPSCSAEKARESKRREAAGNLSTPSPQEQRVLHNLSTGKRGRSVEKWVAILRAISYTFLVDPLPADYTTSAISACFSRQ